MLVVMSHSATPEHIQGVVDTIHEMGYEAAPIPGRQRTAVGLVGNDGKVDASRLEALPGVLEVIHVSQPYKQVSREWREEPTVVELANGTGDAFLHIGAVQAAGYDALPPGAKLKVVVANSVKGQQVQRVVDVDLSSAQEQRPAAPRGGGFDGPRPRRQAPDPSTAVTVVGKVKWFDETKGFGFVQSNDGGKDVFVHISILAPSGVSRLAEGQPVTMQVVDTAKGREALSIAVD